MNANVLIGSSLVAVAYCPAPELHVTGPNQGVLNMKEILFGDNADSLAALESHRRGK